MRGLEFAGPREERSEGSWKCKLPEAQTPESGGGGAGGLDSWVQGRRDPGLRLLALVKGGTGLGDCKKTPKPFLVKGRELERKWVG